MHILFVFGTRPEAIKLAPLIVLGSEMPNVEISVCITAQHREMLDEVLDFFEIEVHYDLNLMTPNQGLLLLTSRILAGMQDVIEKSKPNLIVVQGDTTTAMAAALAGFYSKVNIAHVEAGLRSFDKMQPFPEEINRKIISQLADYHFAPTEASAANLKAEGTKGDIRITGNTVIDALFMGLQKIETSAKNYYEKFPFLNRFNGRIILVTVHRRENFGQPLTEICNVIAHFASIYPDLLILIPVHPNPNVQKTVSERLSDNAQVRLLNPLKYDELIWLMQQCFLVLTDSGGIQEEAPSLGKPVIVMRNVTERMEGVIAGNAILAGNTFEGISKALTMLLEDKVAYQNMAAIANPYGDGSAAEKIFNALLP